jgi:hypothetical protein
MSVTHIIDGLEMCPATGAAADARARLGFLEWVIAQDGAVTAQTAQRAVSDVSRQTPNSQAACAFVRMLQEACVAPSVPARRRAGRRACRVGHAH